MSFTAPPAPLRSSRSLTMAVALLTVALAFDQLLLACFLGHVPLWAALPAAMLVVLPAVLLVRRSGFRARASAHAKTALICVAAATMLFVLGGEGRLFYAHPDWQVRSAVLRDLTLYPWPFVYDVRGAPDLLRAPIGMYLAPALVGKGLGYPAAEWALLMQNSALLGLLFFLGSCLFDGVRSRWIALGIFVGFSGMDLVGQLLTGQPLLLTSDRWNVAIFQSHVTMAFAVPQHEMAGWIAALLFLLWRDRRISLAAFLTPVPLLALWSPFSVMGIAPFAALAGIVSVRRRELRLRDIAMPAAASVIAFPGLVYLASGSGAVGGGEAGISLSQWVIFELIEVGPYLLALAFLGWRGRFGGATLVVTAGALMVAPLFQIGTSADFVMRASIPALAILAVAVADVLARPRTADDRLWRGVMIGAFAIGLATPSFDILRAVVYPRAPPMVCSYFGVVPDGFATYVTPLSQVNRLIAPPAPTMIRPHDPKRCWLGKWPNALYREFPERVAPEDRDYRL